MDADLLHMPKGPEAAAKWQRLPSPLQDLARFEFKTTMLDGRQEWEMDCKIEVLADGRLLIAAQISMKFGEFAFMMFPRAKKIALVDFHLYGDILAEATAVEVSAN